MRLVRPLTSTLLLLAASCAAFPGEYPRQISVAVKPSTETLLGKLVSLESSQNPGKSGFTLIESGKAAFSTRLAMVDAAEQAIDIQYYIWDSDLSGLVLAERLIRAADRGVRVRVLIDDLATAGRDSIIAMLDVHPNIEIRVFNPSPNRQLRAFNALLDTERMNNRMHNKVFIVDGIISIIGGRNISDSYFDFPSKFVFRDLDLMVLGDLVGSASSCFDYFWNGDWSVPINTLVPKKYIEEDLSKLEDRMRDNITRLNVYQFDDIYSISEYSIIYKQIRNSIWAHGSIMWDNPIDVKGGVPKGKILNKLREIAKGLRHEVLIESAYFVIPEPEEKLFGDLVSRGVRVRVLTNSMESTDVIAAHAGHAAHRKDLILRGVEIYELKAQTSAGHRQIGALKSQEALHTKALVFDRNTIFIGSFNLDPRSALINTEVGVFVESAELAADLIKFLDEGVLPSTSYRVELDNNGDLLWITERDGSAVILHEEPGAVFGRSIVVDLIKILPIEDIL